MTIPSAEGTPWERTIPFCIWSYDSKENCYTKFHILRLKCTKFTLDWCFASDTAGQCWGSLQCSPRPSSI